MADPAAVTQVLDVRQMPKPDKHPAIFAAFDALSRGDAFVLVNDHDPKHLREEFERDRPGSFSWDYLSRERRDWQIRIGKLTSTALPRVLADTSELAAQAADPDVTGAVWNLAERDRDLDANVIALPPGEAIDTHAGPDLDVLVHVLGGSGELGTETDPIALAPGALVWLPRRSIRTISAGPGGLRYLTVHKRRQALVLDTQPRAAAEADPSAAAAQAR